MSVPGYDIHESIALPTFSLFSKWGVVAAVRRDLHCQCIQALDRLAGLVIVIDNVDIAIPTSSACSLGPWWLTVPFATILGPAYLPL